MNRKLTTDQILQTCQELSNPSVRTVMQRLSHKYGVRGRTDRIRTLLNTLKQQAAPPLPSTPVAEPERVSLENAQLREQLAQALERASRAEDLERRHQDYFAARYAEQLEALKNRLSARDTTEVTSEQYLRLYQRAHELATRLAKYEDVGPLLPPAR